jgi:hypothetical protein
MKGKNMPQEQSLKKPEKQEEIKNEESVDTLSALFDERDRPKSEEKEGRKAPESQKGEEAQVDKSSPQKEAVKAVKEDKDEDNNDDNDTSELDTLRGELQKTQKRLSENQQYGRQNAQKVKKALKITQTLIGEGLLTDEEAKGLMDTLQSEGEEGEEYHKGDAHPFAPIFRIANTELENIRKYTDDEFLQDKVDAFDYFLSVSSKEEIEEALEELTELMDNPVKLTKKMLSIGQKAYEESYKEIKEAGGFKHYLSQKNQEVEKLRKKIDKMEKKLAQYEDFDKPRYRMDETGDSEDGKPAQDTITALFAERDQVKRR